MALQARLLIGGTPQTSKLVLQPDKKKKSDLVNRQWLKRSFPETDKAIVEYYDNDQLIKIIELELSQKATARRVLTKEDEETGFYVWGTLTEGLYPRTLGFTAGMIDKRKKVSQ